MNMYIKNVCRLVCASLMMSSMVFADAAAERAQLAQALVSGLGEKLLWVNLRNPDQRDVLQHPLISNDAIAHKDHAVTLFFTRASRLTYSVGDFVDLAEVKDIAYFGLLKKFLTANVEPDENDYGTQLEFDTAHAAWTNATSVRAEKYATDIKGFASQITFQEHRVGAVLEKEWTQGNYYLSARSWVGIAERNYWLDAQYRAGITGIMKELFPSNDGAFNLSDYVGTNWGMGDIHLKGGVITRLTPNITVRNGAKIVLPTAGQKKRNTAHQIVPLTMSQIQSYGRLRLNEILISPQLGNNGHYGVGAWSDATWTQKYVNGTQELTLQALGSIDYLCESAEERLVMRNTYPALAADAQAYSTGQDANFRSFIGRYVLPEPVEVVIAPGAVVRLGATAQYLFPQAQFFMGYDWYYKNKEQIGSFNHPEDAPVYFAMQRKAPVASTQHTVHGGIAHNALHKNVSFLWYTIPQLGVSVALKGAFSFGSVGMANEFGFGFTMGLKY